MSDNPAGKLLRSVEGVAYWAAVAPALARLPATLGYRVACWRGDLLFRCQARKRTELAHNVQLVLGDKLSPAAAQQVVRDWFRLTSCGPVDVKRLRHGAGPLRRLIEIRGREHIEAALAAGKGVILCSAHFGSHASGLSVLHASGFPVTHIGRWDHNYNYDYRVNYNVRAGVSSAERWFWEAVYARPVLRYRQRPNIEPWPGRPQVAMLAAAALRANEVVSISIDAPPLDNERARAVDVPFLGRRSPAAARGRDACRADRSAAAHGFPAPRGRLPPPGLGDLGASAAGGWNRDGIRALRRRGERRHLEKPGALEPLAHSRSCPPRDDRPAGGQVTIRGTVIVPVVNDQSTRPQQSRCLRGLRDAPVELFQGAEAL